MNVNAVVLFEMLSLWVGTLLLFNRNHPNVSAADLVVNIGIPAAVPTLILLALLTAWADIGHSETPAYAGLLIAFSALTYEGTLSAEAINRLVGVWSTYAMSQKNLVLSQAETEVKK